MQLKNSTPFISLCVVTKDNASHIPLTLSSMCDFVDEIIVVDRGSTDGTQQIANEFDAVVYDFDPKETISSARMYALEKATGKWILQGNPGHELIVRQAEVTIKKQMRDGYTGFYLPEYSLKNPDDYYYQPLLYKNKIGLTYNHIFEDSPISKSSRGFSNGDGQIGFLQDLNLVFRSQELKKARIKRKINRINSALKDDPEEIPYYYYLAFCYREIEMEEEFQSAVRQGIQIMTITPPEDVPGIKNSSGLLGYFAESLVNQDITKVSTVNSLLKLQKTLPADVRLNLNLAILLNKLNRTEEAIKLLEQSIFLAFKPNWTTLSFYQGFVESVYQLLEIVRQTRDEETLLRTVLNIQTLATEYKFNIRPVFTFLNDHHPDFLLLIDGVLQRKLGEKI